MKHIQADIIQWEKGTPSPLGVSRVDNGVNFALFSKNATGVTLCLFSATSKHAFAEIPFDAECNKTGQVWHILLKHLPDHVDYGYKVTGPNDNPCYRFDPKRILSDPYARALNTSHQWSHKTLNEESRMPLGRVILDAPFDWQDARPPKIPMEDVILYEMHVRAFTQHPSSHAKAMVKPSTAPIALGDSVKRSPRCAIVTRSCRRQNSWLQLGRWPLFRRLAPE